MNRVNPSNLWVSSDMKANLQHVGAASNAPALKDAGKDPNEGTLSFGISTWRNWDVISEENTFTWVLDPVAIGSLAHRTALARELIAMGPAVVRGNASEIMALLGAGGGRGPETAADVEAAMDAAHSVSERFGCVVAVSGPVDAIVDGAHVTRIVGGSPMLTRVTGGGCALGALIAAFIAAGRARDVGGSRGECAGADTTRACTVACHAVYSAAAKRAEARSAGPGSFQPAFLDALYDLETDDLGSITISAADTVGREPA